MSPLPSSICFSKVRIESMLISRHVLVATLRQCRQMPRNESTYIDTNVCSRSQRTGDSPLWTSGIAARKMMMEDGVRSVRVEMAAFRTRRKMPTHHAFGKGRQTFRVRCPLARFQRGTNAAYATWTNRIKRKKKRKWGARLTRNGMKR